VPDLTVLAHPACGEHDLPDSSTIGTHVERPARIPSVREGIDDVDADIAHEQARAVKRDALAYVHTPEHVRSIEQACQQGTMIDQDTYTRPESWRAALAAAGCALDAARTAIDGQPTFAIPRPPGHHATPDQAMGFCLFNNAAIAAETLTREGHTVAIVDVDVHHGNGTQDVFYERADVLFASIHQSPFYPGTGMAHETGRGAGADHTINLPVPADTGHAGWLELLRRVIVPALETYAPDLVIVSAGFDAHREDHVGGLALVADTVHEAIRELHVGAPVCAILEGGYSLDALIACAGATAAALAGAENPHPETIRQGVRPWPMLESDVTTHLAEAWPIRSGRRGLESTR
jgi:acetoin utilization deacetylase AcuC-like enzyme